MEWDSMKVAAELGVSQRRVRAMCAAGRLSGRQVGGSWVVESSQVQRFKARGAGRPVSARNAWAMLAHLAGDRIPWVDPAVASRLRKRVSDKLSLIEALRGSEPRAHAHSLRVLEEDLPKLQREFRLVRSGLSALGGEFDVVGRVDALDGYIRVADLKSILRRFKPMQSSARPNLLLRVPVIDWVLEQGDSAPSAVIAADLLDHEDIRVRRAAERLLKSSCR